jgi:uncharacterized protein (TIGR00369 family)
MSGSGSEPVDRHLLRVLFEQVIPFNRFLGVRLTQVGDGVACLELPFRPEMLGNPVAGTLHGGAISALLDNAGGVAVWSQIRQDDLLSTVDLRVDYLRPAAAQTLIARAEVVRLGNRVGVVHLRAFHPERESTPVAAGVGVYNIRRTAAGGELWQRLRDTLSGSS